jgi:hypothetical protein
VNETSLRNPLVSPEFRRLQDRLRELRTEQSGLLPPPGFRRLGGTTGEWELTADQRRRLQELELTIDKVTMALNDYCRRHGEPEWF